MNAVTVDQAPIAVKTPRWLKCLGLRSDPENDRAIRYDLNQNLFSTIPSLFYRAVNEQPAKYDETEIQLLLKTAHVCAYLGDLLADPSSEQYYANYLYSEMLASYPDINTWSSGPRLPILKVQHLYSVLRNTVDGLYGRKMRQIAPFTINT